MISTDTSSDSLTTSMQLLERPTRKGMASMGTVLLATAQLVEVQMAESKGDTYRQQCPAIEQQFVQFGIQFATIQNLAVCEAAVRSSD